MSVKKQKLSNKGFTLIEVLLVVALIGILLTTLLVNLNTVNRFTEARNDIRSIHIKTLEGAISQYRLQTGSYPSGLDRNYREICDPDSSTCVNFIDLKTLLVPKYLQAIPQDPNDTDSTGGSGYSIAIDTATNTISIRATQAEAGNTISVNDPLPPVSSTTTTTSIIEDGLVLYLDAGNPASYPGTGTNWTDLSGNGNNGTLINGVAYNGANRGGLVFDGVNDYVNINSNALGFSEGTLCFWIMSNTVRDIYNTHSGNWNQNTLWEEGGLLKLRISNGTLNSGDVSISASLVFDNNFHFVCTQWTTGGERSIWVDGNKLASLNNTLQYIPSSNLEVGYKSWSPSFYSGRMYVITSYNRALMQQEIQQNFNATRGRFGL